MGPSMSPLGTNRSPFPPGRMMKGLSPPIASNAMPPSFGLSSGAFVAEKSGTSLPIHLFCAASHHTHFLRSDHGSPFGSADARLYMIRRFAGHENAQPR